MTAVYASNYMTTISKTFIFIHTVHQIHNITARINASNMPWVTHITAIKYKCC